MFCTELTTEDVKRIYPRMMQDFPDNERKSLKMMLDMFAAGTMCGFGWFDGEGGKETAQREASQREAPAAYAFFVVLGRNCLFDYLAVASDRRGEGVGSAFFEALRSKWRERGISCVVGEVENPDYAQDEAERAVRERRIAFYRRLGVVDTGVTGCVYGAEYRFLEVPVGVPHTAEEIREIMRSFYRFYWPKEEDYRRHVLIRAHAGTMENGKRVRIGLWGTGAIAKNYVDAVRANSDLCELACLINHHADRAENLKRKENLDVPVFTSFEEARRSLQLDAVCVLLPPHLHKAAVVEAAKAHCHVLVEKPMANSLEECDAMIAAAERSGVLLMTICQKRFTTEAMRVTRLLQEGRFGEPRFTSVQSLWLRGEQYHDLSWRGSWEYEGGGVLTTQAIHHLDLIESILGRPGSVSAVIGNVGHRNTECEDWASVVLRYEGSVVQFTSSLVSAGQRQEISICTDQNYCLSIPWKPKADTIAANGFPQENTAGLAGLQAEYERIPELLFENHAGQLRNFLEAVQGTAKPYVLPENGRDVVELLSAIYESAALHKEVFLPLSREDVWYTVQGKMHNMPHFYEKVRSFERMQEG